MVTLPTPTTAKKQKNLSLSDVRYAISLIKNNEKRPVSELLKDTVVYTSMGKPIRAKTLGQKRYIDNINDNDIVLWNADLFGIP